MLFQAGDSVIGERFNKWTVLSEVRRPKQHCKHYECRCDCGNTGVIQSTTLRLGRSKQCRDCSFRRHSMAKTRIYKIWAGILTRCNNPKVNIYKYYGGRGITVCDRWKDFANFYADMGDRIGNMQVDRIDNDKGYSPENCRWVTPEENMNNRRVKIDDMPGKRFGKWTVLERVIHKPDHWYYSCRCDCGTVNIINGGSLRRPYPKGTTQCMKCKRIEHGIIHKGWNARKKASV